MRRARAQALAAVLLAVCTVIAFQTGMASAATTLDVTPATGLTNGQSVAVSGSGFTPGSLGGVIQCSNDPTQPTVDVLGSQVPVSCTNPLLKLTSGDGSGNISVASFIVTTGVTGPPATGTDSSGGDAATSAADYPCPPTQAQIDAGVTCVVAFGNQAGEQATKAISFAGQGTTTTTGSGGSTSSSSSSSTTSTSSTSTTSTSTTSTSTPATGPSLAVSPSTDLTDGQTVTVTGSGFTPASPGGIIQCSDDPTQPTVLTLGNAVPVSCTDPLLKLVTPSGDGKIPPTELTVRTGTVGPPASGTGSDGRDAATSAAEYPCPPTQAQTDDGVSCVIAFGNLAGEQATAEISFAGEPSTAPPPGTSTDPPPEASVLGGQETASGPGGQVAAQSDTLPRTGNGWGLLRLAAIAIGLLDLGYLALSATWPERRGRRKGGTLRSA